MTLKPPTPESVLKYETRLALGREKDLTIFNNPAGVTGNNADPDFMILQSVLADVLPIPAILSIISEYSNALRKNQRFIRYGLAKGACDLLGILAPLGRWFCIELKVGKNKPSNDQNLFMNLIRSKGGFAKPAWSVDEVKAALERARGGANE